MANDLDELMSQDPLSLTKSDLDAIIGYHRNNRAKTEAEGVRKGRGKAAGPAPKGKIDLTSLIAGMGGTKPAAPAPTPPTGGIRRLK